MRLLRLFLVSSLFLSVLPAEPRTAPAPARNVVVVTIDGVRWQEVFTGADRAYFKPSRDGKPKIGRAHV